MGIFEPFASPKFRCFSSNFVWIYACFDQFLAKIRDFLGRPRQISGIFFQNIYKKLATVLPEGKNREILRRFRRTP